MLIVHNKGEVTALDNQHRFTMITYNQGDPVKVVGGKYKGLSAVIVKPTEKMYYLWLLDRDEVVRVMACSVVKVDDRSKVVEQIADELQEIRKRMEALEHLLHDMKLQL